MFDNCGGKTEARRLAVKKEISRILIQNFYWYQLQTAKTLYVSSFLLIPSMNCFVEKIRPDNGIIILIFFLPITLTFGIGQNYFYIFFLK